MTQTTIGYALFKNGERISKFHSTKAAVVTEAYEVGAIGYAQGNVFMFPEYKIEETIQ